MLRVPVCHIIVLSEYLLFVQIPEYVRVVQGLRACFPPPLEAGVRAGGPAGRGGHEAPKRGLQRCDGSRRAGRRSEDGPFSALTKLGHTLLLLVRSQLSLWFNESSKGFSKSDGISTGSLILYIKNALRTLSTREGIYISSSLRRRIKCSNDSGSNIEY